MKEAKRRAKEGVGCREESELTSLNEESMRRQVDGNRWARRMLVICAAPRQRMAVSDVQHATRPHIVPCIGREMDGVEERSSNGLTQSVEGEGRSTRDVILD